MPPIFSSCSDKDSVKLVVFSPSRLHDLNEAAQATTLEAVVFAAAGAGADHTRQALCGGIWPDTAT